MIIKNNNFDIIILIIVIIFIIFIIVNKLFFYNKYLEKFSNNYNYNNINNNNDLLLNNNDLLLNNKSIIWNYWETPIGKKKPGYIDLCHQSVLHNCSNCFTIISLNENNIKNYLPNIDQYNLKNLAIPQKVDFYRYLLLEKYGGLWIDADIIILKCLCPYYKKLKNYDYVGFGCGFNKKTCKNTMNGYGRPLNWMMASRPNTNFMKCIKNNAIEKIENQNKIEYHGIGKDILAKCHDNLKKDENWSYYHIKSKCQEYDSFGNKLNRIFTDFNNTDCSDRYFFPFYNTSPGLPDWFKALSANELKNSTLNINRIIKEAFIEKEKCNKYT